MRIELGLYGSAKHEQILVDDMDRDQLLELKERLDAELAAARLSKSKAQSHLIATRKYIDRQAWDQIEQAIFTHGRQSQTLQRLISKCNTARKKFNQEPRGVVRHLVDVMREQFNEQEFEALLHEARKRHFNGDVAKPLPPIPEPIKDSREGGGE